MWTTNAPSIKAEAAGCAGRNTGVTGRTAEGKTSEGTKANASEEEPGR